MTSSSASSSSTSSLEPSKAEKVEKERYTWRWKGDDFITFRDYVNNPNANHISSSHEFILACRELEINIQYDYHDADVMIILWPFTALATLKNVSLKLTTADGITTHLESIHGDGNTLSGEEQDNVFHEKNTYVDITVECETHVDHKMVHHLESGLHADVTLKCADGTDIKAHKVILSSRSLFFFKAFSGAFAENKTNDIKIGFNAETVHTMLLWMYGRDIKIFETIKDVFGAMNLIECALFHDMPEMATSTLPVLLRSMTIKAVTHGLNLYEKLHAMEPESEWFKIGEEILDSLVPYCELKTKEVLRLLAKRPVLDIYVENDDPHDSHVTKKRKVDLGDLSSPSSVKK